MNAAAGGRWGWIGLAAFMCWAAGVSPVHATVPRAGNPEQEAARLQRQGDVFPGPVRLTLPSVIYAVPGIETNVYFENVILAIDSTRYVFDVHCAKGDVRDERWSFTPAAADTGSYPFTLEVRDDTNAVIARAVSVVRVAAAEAGAGTDRTLLLVGDSWTSASVYPEHLFTLGAVKAAPAITLVGSRGPDGAASGAVRHEGYSGWTAEAFATLRGQGLPTGRPNKSPFMYEGEDGQLRLDFKRYCEAVTKGVAPDFVVLTLGVNDVFSATDTSIDGRIDRMLAHYDRLIEMIQAVRADTRIGVVLVPPPGATQDGFKGYKGSQRQTRWQFRRNQHRLIERIQEKFAQGHPNFVSLVPAFTTLDTRHGYPTVDTPENARTSVTSRRINNGTHPSVSGYQQYGDSLYCWLKAMIAAEADGR